MDVSSASKTSPSSQRCSPYRPPSLLMRRTVWQTALVGGVSALVPVVNIGGGASPAPRALHAPLPQRSPVTLTLVTNRAPSDLDPHSAYDAGSGVVLQGPFEGLIRLKSGTANDYVPVLASSWSASADQSIWTFQLRAGVTFQDGTPLTAEDARASFERLLTLQLAPSTVLGRFIDDPARVKATGPNTLV